MVVYFVIGVIMFAVTIWSVRSTRDIDGKDVFVALTVFGVVWPIGVITMGFSGFIDIINKTRK